MTIQALITSPTSNIPSAFAFAGNAPWHGLGRNLQDGATLDQWTNEAGFSWEAKVGPVAYYPNAHIAESGTPVVGHPVTLKNQVCIYRSDTQAPLSIMSGGYKLVQPKQVMEFFRDVAEAGKLKMETAGMLKGGAVYWALARINDQFSVTKDDPILPYVLMATSLDGSLSTTVGFSSVRVVCYNTLQMAVGRGNNNTTIKVPHNSLFDESRVKAELGLVEGQWDNFKRVSAQLASREVNRAELIQFMVDVFTPESKRDKINLLEADNIVARAPNIRKCLDLYESGVGQSTKSAKGTAWGALNVITRYQDHEVKAISNESKLRSAWFGECKRRKERALQLALKLTTK